MSVKNNHIAAVEAFTKDYQIMFDSMVIAPDKVKEVDEIVSLIQKGKAVYEAIQKITNVPWVFIGLVHYRESNCNFYTHLHNGDPLSSRTVNEPKGRPVKGDAPFTFEESAVDALQLQGLTTWTDWSIPGMLYQLHRYNGFGYETYHNIHSPYLWSYTQYYDKGLYVRDKVFDANAISKQAGVAPILRRLMEKNNMYTAVAVGSGLLILIAACLFIFYNKGL